MAMDSVDLTLDDGWLDPLQARSEGPRGPGRGKKVTSPSHLENHGQNHGLIWFNGDKWWIIYGLMVQNVVYYGLMVINGE